MPVLSVLRFNSKGVHTVRLPLREKRQTNPESISVQARSGASVLHCKANDVFCVDRRPRSDNVIEDIQDKLQDVRNPVAAMMGHLREMDLESDAELATEGTLAPGRSTKAVATRDTGNLVSVSPCACGSTVTGRDGSLGFPQEMSWSRWSRSQSSCQKPLRHDYCCEQLPMHFLSFIFRT